MRRFLRTTSSAGLSQRVSPTTQNTFFHTTSKLMGVDRKVLKEGTGARPKAGDKITVHCTGMLADRKKFWSTLDDNKPFSFNVGMGQVIRGWDEGMLQMSIGEKAELTMTGDYAYGPRGFPAWGIPPNATLIFEIEMLKIN